MPAKSKSQVNPTPAHANHKTVAQIDQAVNRTFSSQGTPYGLTGSQKKGPSTSVNPKVKPSSGKEVDSVPAAKKARVAKSEVNHQAKNTTTKGKTSAQLVAAKRTVGKPLATKTNPKPIEKMTRSGKMLKVSSRKNPHI